MSVSDHSDADETIHLEDFETKLSEHLNELRLGDLFCDVRFDVNGTIFSCHRIVLVTVSPYFKTMFSGNFLESKSDTVTMHDIDSETFEAILNAIYTASIHFNASNAYSILKASHFLQLEAIQNAFVSYIKKNRKIDYLIDACVFAKQVQLDDLYEKCVTIIADREDILYYGKTDSFARVPFEVFEDLLTDVNSDFSMSADTEEPYILLILKWAKLNNSSRRDVEKLIDAFDSQFNRMIRSQILSQILVSCDHTALNGENTTSMVADQDSELPLHLYLDAIDVKTGQFGWVMLKMSAELDKYYASSFYPTNSKYRKVCKVGPRIYSFEFFGYPDVKDVFSYYDEDNNQHLLPTPKLLSNSFELVASKTHVYLIDKGCGINFSIWSYASDQNSWDRVICENNEENPFCGVRTCIFSQRGVFYVIARKKDDKREFYGHKNYIFSINASTLIVEQLSEVPKPPYNIYNIICRGEFDLTGICDTRDGKIINYNLPTQTWSKCSRETEFDRHDLLCTLKDCIYVLKNDEAIFPNAKYDFTSSEWTDVPSLPKRVTIAGTNKTVATGHLFGVQV